MDYNYYLSVGFVPVGQLLKSNTITKKHKVQMQWQEGYSPEAKMGVYLICKGDGILKIGETQNLRHRFTCYESHNGPTNTMVRENMGDEQTYPILFLECPSYIVEFGGVKVPNGINYRILEKNLLTQFESKTGALPIWNKGKA